MTQKAAAITSDILFFKGPAKLTYVISVIETTKMEINCANLLKQLFENTQFVPHKKHVLLRFCKSLLTCLNTVKTNFRFPKTQNRHCFTFSPKEIVSFFLHFNSLSHSMTVCVKGRSLTGKEK